MEGAIIRNNKSDLKSAAVMQLNNPESTVNVYGGEFYNNNSTYWGGVFLSWGKINIWGGTFKDNYAQATGGSALLVHYDNSNKLEVVSSSFEENSASFGGGIYLMSGSK